MFTNRLLYAIHHHIIQAKTQPPNVAPLSPKARKQITNLEIHEPVSSGKVRYVGGAIVAKKKHKVGKSLEQKLTRKTTDKGQMMLIMYELLSVAAGEKESMLSGSSYQQSLGEIKYKMKGQLTILTDECYEWFNMMEIKRIEQLSADSLLQKGGSLPALFRKDIGEDDAIQQKWLQITRSKSNSF